MNQPPKDQAQKLEQLKKAHEDIKRKTEENIGRLHKISDKDSKKPGSNKESDDSSTSPTPH